MTGADDLEAASAAKPQVRRSLDQGLVLIADDDLATRAAAAELLVDLDFWPVTARNGLEALELLRRGVTPALMLVDLYMPLMDGEAFCAAVDEDPVLRKIPRYLISANPDGESRTQQCGAMGFLRKPIANDELLDALSKSHVKP